MLTNVAQRIGTIVISAVIIPVGAIAKLAMVITMMTLTGAAPVQKLVSSSRLLLCHPAAHTFGVYVFRLVSLPFGQMLTL